MRLDFKRAAALFLSIIYLILLYPSFSFAEEPFFLFTFEDEESSLEWVGASRDEMCAYEGEWGLLNYNPYNSGHVLEYNNLISLEEGEFYTFSAYVMNPLSETVDSSVASAYTGRGNSELFIDISNVSYEWELVSASFMATESVDIPLIITFDGGNLDVGVFIDNVSIAKETRVPKYTVLEGSESVFIPESGYSEYRYSLVTYDTNDMPINILLSDPEITIENLPEGVEFDEASGKLRVYSTAEKNQTFTLTYSPSVNIDIDFDNAKKVITTTKNLLSDPGFVHGEENWTSDGLVTYDGDIMSLYADKQGAFGYYSTISYSRQVLLLSGNMYVFRAIVSSDDEFEASSVYISNLSFAQSGYAEINITGIGGTWQEVTAAFMIEDTGLYDLSINLYAPTQRPIYIDEVYLGVEQAAPTSVSIHAPGHIQAPSDTTILPCYALVRDQMGNVIEDCEAQISLSPESSGVYLENGNVIVTSSAQHGDYTISSSFGEITSSHTITISPSAVGDGGFEEKEANEWWTASDGSIFSIIDYNAGKAGHVYSPEPSCIIINNSYMTLNEGEYYVFSAAPGVGEGIITAFIAEHETGEYIPFAQYSPTEGIKTPFSLSSTVMGRLVLHVESEDSVGVVLDNISIDSAELSVSDVSVTKSGYGERLYGSYVYFNNMTDLEDVDISSTRWYISATYDGHYEPIGAPNSEFISVTPEMMGQYILFEVTPVCAYTSIVGDTVRSAPFKISLTDENASNDDTGETKFEPIEIQAAAEHPFTDINSHWAEGIISSLTASGVISGRTANRFAPEHPVTRAEFVTMVSRAFSLVSVPYTGKFTDISASDWYSGWIEAAYKRGIISGNGDDTFSPGKNITREEMAAIIIRAYRLAEGPPLPYELNLKYHDEFLISEWAYEDVKLCTNLNILSGDDMNLFRPREHATRAEAAACIFRALKSF